MALRLLVRPLVQHSVPRLARSFASRKNRGAALNGGDASGSNGRVAPAAGDSQQPRPGEPLKAHSNAPEQPREAPPPPGEQPMRAAPPPPMPPDPTQANVPSLDFAPAPPARARTGARAAGGVSPADAQRSKTTGRMAFLMALVGLGATAVYLGRDWDPEELKRRRAQEVGDVGTGMWAASQRAKARTLEMTDYFSKPAWQELLPPPLPPTHQKPYTLLLSIDDLLVTSTWDREHGWRTAKRPGVDYFLAYLSQFYEIVIFTSQPFYHAGPIVDKIDPYSFYIMYRLFREATRAVDGKIVKDLSYLNRDLSKVVALDTHAEHFNLHPENALIVPGWDGNPKDKGLIALIPFLESIGIYKPDDVRPILQKYSGTDVPLEYAKHEAEAKQAFLEEYARTHGGRVTTPGGVAGGGWTLSRLFSGTTSEQKAGGAPLTYLEIKRREAQALYREEQAYLAKNEAEIKRQIDEEMKERERIAREQGGSLVALVSSLARGGPPPTPPPQKDEKEHGKEKEGAAGTQVPVQGK